MSFYFTIYRQYLWTTCLPLSDPNRWRDSQ